MSEQRVNNLIKAQMAGDKYCYRDVLPFAAMVTMECLNVGLNTLYKAATMKGMSEHVFVVYAYAVAALCLLPSPFFTPRCVCLHMFVIFFIHTFICHIYLLGNVPICDTILNHDLTDDC